MISPIPIRPNILSTVFIEKGLVLDIANGTAIPIIKTNDGKTKSAGLNPFQLGCFSHQGASFDWQSTNIIPNIVSPRSTSSEFSLCFSVLIGTFYS